MASGKGLGSAESEQLADAIHSKTSCSGPYFKSAPRILYLKGNFVNNN